MSAIRTLDQSYKLTYASPHDPLLKRLLIMGLEYSSGRLKIERLYRDIQSTDLTPREIVSELDRFIIGQNDAKRAVAVALRNRWRRKQLDDDLRD
ncbi:MAG: hypothetical protein AAGM67_19965, partial [Bacteroidota bacterium]